MGNPSQRYAVILRSAGTPPARAIVYVLDGYFGNGMSMLADPGPVGRSFADELLAYQQEGTLPPCHFVFIDGGTRLGGSQYINSAACGSFSDHIAHEVIPSAEAHLGAAGLPRIVMGHSSGGYGALRLPMEHPALFSGSIVSAADCFFEFSMRSLFLNCAIRINRAGGIDAFLAEFFARTYPERCPSADFQTLMMLAMASCYSPEVGLNAAHARLPFEPASLEVDETVWQRWLSNDPLHFPDARLSQLAKLDFLLFDCGTEDEYGAQFGHRKLSKRLRHMGVQHILQEFSGSHSATRYRYKQRLAMMGEWLRQIA
jgi:enterochelin esterase family protein